MDRATRCYDVGGRTTDDVSLSYLPLSHIAEQMCTAAHACDRGRRRCTSPSRSRRSPRTSRKRGRPRSSACRESGRSFTPGSRGKLARGDGRRRSGSPTWARGVCTQGQRASRSRRADSRARCELQYRARDQARDQQGQGRARLRPRDAAVLGRRTDRARRARVHGEPRSPDPRRSTVSPRTAARPRATCPAARGSAASVRRSRASRSRSPTTARS